MFGPLNLARTTPHDGLGGPSTRSGSKLCGEGESRAKIHLPNLFHPERTGGLFKMIGLDILHLPRIHTLLYKRGAFSQRFIQRILHPNESKQLPTEPTSLVRYLGTRYPLCLDKLMERFAAKEAAYKAFQPERKVTWKDLEVWKHTSGRIPDVTFLMLRKTIYSNLARNSQDRLPTVNKSRERLHRRSSHEHPNP